MDAVGGIMVETWPVWLESYRGKNEFKDKYLNQVDMSLLIKESPWYATRRSAWITRTSSASAWHSTEITLRSVEDVRMTIVVNGNSILSMVLEDGTNEVKFDVPYPIERLAVGQTSMYLESAGKFSVERCVSCVI